MKKEPHSFDVDNLHYLKIEHEILKHYNLGFSNSSSLPADLHENDSGDYYITGTRASLKFYLDIKRNTDGKYTLVCYPE